MIALGVIPGTPSLDLRTPSGETRQCRNPFTGGIETIEMSKHQQLQSVEQVSNACVGHPDYKVEVSGEGIPSTPPLQIEFSAPYYVSVTCRVSIVLRSTSDLQDDVARTEARIPFFDDPCNPPIEDGFFTNPHTGETIVVPGAGCTRFWVLVELGKFLFPQIKRGNLEILNPTIARTAEEVFGIQFAQGCHWG